MRKAIAALTAALLYTVLAAPVVDASPTEVNVRIEGRSETLFEGPVLTDGHDVEASSEAVSHPCDGLNNGKYPTPGPTPTAASVDAMSILGEDFDGQWYSGFDDFFITRWGPDSQSVSPPEYWGVLVNNVLTSVGGCQYQLDAGDEVVWVYDAFGARPMLALFPASYSGGARPLTATATLHQPFAVEVDSYEDDAEGAPPAVPERTGSSPFEGASVAPVATDAEGFQRVDAGAAGTVVTGAGGRAEITFDEPGWHRIKATVVGSDGEDAIRSNRLDVCVPDPPAGDCGAPPADDLVRAPAEDEEDGEPGGDDEPGGGGQGPVEPAGPGSDPPASPAPDVHSPTAGPPVSSGSVPGIRWRLSRLGRSRIDRGLVGVRWRVLDPGPGIKGWTISSRRIGARRAPWVTRARGAGGTSATLHLPRGAAYGLRLTVADVLGRSSSAMLGRVRVPG